MSKQHALRTISAARANECLAPIGTTPATESQVRPLVALPADQRAEVWARAVESNGGKQPTARQVANAIRPTNNAITKRCDVIMRELRGNPELAKLVRIELMTWYALNG